MLKPWKAVAKVAHAAGADAPASIQGGLSSHGHMLKHVDQERAYIGELGSISKSFRGITHASTLRMYASILTECIDLGKLQEVSQRCL